jgi:hypothetical protein
MTEYAYIVEDLYNKIDEVKSLNTEVEFFMETFNFQQVLDRKNEKNNSFSVFKDNVSENEVKCAITRIFNKLNKNNIEKSAIEIKSLNFETSNDYNELVRQCINKIKITNEQMRYYMGSLCTNLHYLFYNPDKKENRLLTAIRNEYLEFIKFNIEKNADKKILLVISTFYDVKILDDVLISKIFDDFRKYIKYDENKNYEIVEYAIQHLCYFIHSFGSNGELLLLSKDSDSISIDTFLNTELLLYGKNISKKTILTVENTIEEVYKKNNNPL